MRTLLVVAALGMVAALSVPPKAAAQLFNGYRRLDPEGIDRPPGPIPNTRKGKHKTYEPVVGSYPRCTCLMWTGTRCRLSTGQVCTVYAHGLDGCI
ncbi:MAG: hypothetical protein ABI391_09210 [Hyphomicrobiaceae bacterium]